MDKYNRSLFDYYQRLMQVLVLVGDELAWNGISEVNARYPWLNASNANCTVARGAIPGEDGESSLYVMDSQDRRHPFPIHWGRLRDAIRYSQTEYGDFDDWWLVDAGSQNTHGIFIPGWIRLNQDQFDGRDQEALQDMIHEPLHDLRQYGSRPFQSGHKAIKDVVPTGVGPRFHPLINPYLGNEWAPIGGVPVSKYDSDWEQFIGFLQNTDCGNGSSLWDNTRDWTGPRPTKPIKPKILQ